MFCPKCGEEISIREKEDAEKIRRLRELVIKMKHSCKGMQDFGLFREINMILEECK